MTKKSKIQKFRSKSDYKDQIADLRSDVERLQGDFRNLRQEFTEDAKDHLHEFRDQAGQKIKVKGEELRDASERGQRKVKEKLRRHPVISALAATGAGVAIGTLASWAQNAEKQQNSEKK